MTGSRSLLARLTVQLVPDPNVANLPPPSARPAPGGRFEFTDVPAGRYLVAHVDRLAPGELWDPAFLKTLANSRTVTVAEGQQATVQLRVK